MDNGQYILDVYPLCASSQEQNMNHSLYIYHAHCMHDIFGRSGFNLQENFEDYTTWMVMTFERISQIYNWKTGTEQSPWVADNHSILDPIP